MAQSIADGSFAQQAQGAGTEPPYGGEGDGEE